MEMININGLDKSILSCIEMENGHYILKKGQYSVARELATLNIAYVARYHYDIEKAIFNPNSEIGKYVEFSKKNVSTKGAMIIEKEMLDEIKVIIPKEINFSEITEGNLVVKKKEITK